MPSTIKAGSQDQAMHPRTACAVLQVEDQALARVVRNRSTRRSAPLSGSAAALPYPLRLAAEHRVADNQWFEFAAQAAALPSRVAVFFTCQFQ